MGTYRDNEGNIRPELLDQEAREIANSFVRMKEFFNQKTKKKEKKTEQLLSSAQLRKFFGEFRQLEKKITAKGFDPAKPLIKMVKSKAEYAANPSKSGRIPKEFKQFIINNVNNIETQEDFTAFMLHFEAVVGFFYGIEGVKNN